MLEMHWVSAIVHPGQPGTAYGRICTLIRCAHYRRIYRSIHKPIQHPQTVRCYDGLVGVGALSLSAFLGKLATAHEVGITLPGNRTAFVDGPHNQRLSAAHITCRKDTLHTGAEATVVGFYVGTCILLQI